MKTIVIYADVPERFRFFSEAIPALKTLGYAVHMVTARYSVYRMARKRNIDVTLLRRFGHIYETVGFDTQRSLSVVSRYHSAEDAFKIAGWAQHVLDEIFKRHHVAQVWVWNGTTTIGRAIVALAKEYGYATRIFELANLPERIFVDPSGIAGESYLYAHPEVLDDIVYDESAYIQWKSGFLKHSSTPPQAKHAVRIPWENLWDYIGYIVAGALREDKRCIISILYKRLRNRFIKRQTNRSFPSKPYLFLPLQVSDDAQVKLFSHYDNHDMINIALKLSRQTGLNLVVKIHPAESDTKIIASILRRGTLENFEVSQYDTKRLVAEAEMIIVNNSTVGLEAMIAEKNVHIYGQAVYSHFNRKRLKAYIMEYLTKCDYFCATKYDPSLVKSWIELPAIKE
jgi:capsular polysaccharide export protein